MTIKILSKQLISQISAGEIVDRPASVVKELVENSLDSGATVIDIEIEKGGIQLIRIRDNGKGILKNELTLALSRHATSKIRTLDDLSLLSTLGFRGEALASISAVSRLILTSRPVIQDIAWSIYSEGMEMKVQPVSHPLGTSVEVINLFFNMPARRRFLCTDRTEFIHIDELIKRIALSRFDIKFSLRHNNKIIRQYYPARNELEIGKRIAAVCGNAFVCNMIKVELIHYDLKLYGWISSPNGSRKKGDLQYFYVNGRVVRDRFINHAIRKSYANFLKEEQFVAYVLFIEIHPNQIDVNVHPAKYEIHFYKARLVHDFIYRAINNALVKSHDIDIPYLSIDKHQSKEKNKNLIVDKSDGIIEKQLNINPTEKNKPIEFLGKAIAVIQNRYVVMDSKQGVVLISLGRAEWLKIRAQFGIRESILLISRPLLIPLLIELIEELVSYVTDFSELLISFGLSFRVKNFSTLIVLGVPRILMNKNLSKLIPDLLSYIAFSNFNPSLIIENRKALANWITNYIISVKVDYSVCEALKIITELEKIYCGQLPLHDKKFVTKVDFSKSIAVLQS
ncbi:DNA mismatch repair protein mutL [Candidatus Photodesmus katoptron]|uniref:DNA mismatch repair protein MutL n=1 Tax=Candidatus Photodesmus katoptron Akat1 TaxID=1236703 RepID=S3DHS3_9GAMM|nr:DNA mismatch repair endonuclease MutL [Candidatus Photodesmus katoptron]EPE38002.1 DNA mismatch repair protein MutL [Candidatus Photodesmus katoptron Akat1]KEY90742.1 DNA mismatch repair protein mutL [Candidatus Photodesmus katoptron]